MRDVVASVGCEPVEERFEVIDRPEMDSEEETLLAGDAVALDHLGRLSGDFANLVELARRGSDSDDRGERVADRPWVNGRVVAGDDAIPLEPLYAFGDGGCGEVHPAVKLGHRQARVGLKLFQDPLADRVDQRLTAGGPMATLRGRIRAAPGFSYFVGSAIFHYLGPAFAVLCSHVSPRSGWPGCGS